MILRIMIPRAMILRAMVGRTRPVQFHETAAIGLQNCQEIPSQDDEWPAPRAILKFHNRG